MMGKIDNLLENDAAVAIGAGLLCVLGWTAIGLGFIPEAHTESVASVASGAGIFALAAMRRAGAPKRASLGDGVPDSQAAIDTAEVEP